MLRRQHAIVIVFDHRSYVIEFLLEAIERRALRHVLSVVPQLKVGLVDFVLNGLKRQRRHIQT